MPRRTVVATFLLFAAALVSHATRAAAQSPAIQYAYDELGRLVAVVDQQGNAAIYVYDAVGNVLSIQRVDAATLPGVAITAVVPEKGKSGTVVSILGKGFGGAGQNAVAFNGAAASVTQSSSNRIITAVPAAATTGPITVTTPLGSAISPRPFRIVGSLAVTPATARLGPGAVQQFLARDGGAETTNVLWSVDSLIGGDPAVGTIAAQGLYVAPATITSSRTVTVTATSRDDVAVEASAVVTLDPPVLRFLAAASLGIQVTDPGLRALAAPGVAVQPAPDAGALTIVAAAIGVAPPAREAFAGAAPLSVSLEPVITSISPATAARGSTNLALTVAGSGLAGITSIEFLRNDVVDTAVTVTNVTASPDGKQLTAQISIAATTPVGQRVVRGRGPTGVTTSAGTGGNVFTVQ
jgi:YD repeat-containing protein